MQNFQREVMDRTGNIWLGKYYIGKLNFKIEETTIKWQQTGDNVARKCRETLRLEIDIWELEKH